METNIFGLLRRLLRRDGPDVRGIGTTIQEREQAAAHRRLLDQAGRLSRGPFPDESDPVDLPGERS
ncbi:MULTISPECIES: hypothetical protein [unclassified Micromonospora]|uniref:hypothetical protein n=1 Tax=unclassified Micromonospora TaxID=2617518 RepID=UPI0022C43961|nr:hypothetical protein [Micromonospora sp. AKA38]GHJ16234.1 hypothetical protein TPA0908_42290 [Micromonospora sp. AKA38]